MRLEPLSISHYWYFMFFKSEMVQSLLKILLFSDLYDSAQTLLILAYIDSGLMVRYRFLEKKLLALWTMVVEKHDLVHLGSSN